MIDKADKKTKDAFARGRGRPSTSNPEKRRADSAQRQKRYRLKKSRETVLFNGLLNSKDADFWHSLAMDFKAGRNPNIDFSLVDPDDGYNRKTAPLDQFLDRLSVGAPTFDPRYA